MKRFPHVRTFFAVSLLVVFSSVFSRRTEAAPWDLDTGFGTGGGFTASFTAGDDYAYSVAVQSDGKILLAGGSAGGDYSVLRLLPNGSPDPNFGSAGKVVQKFGLFELARGVAETSDGKILVGGAGLVSGGSRDFAVMRLLSNGTLDSTYGTGGIVTTDIQDGFNDVVNCMAVDTGGRAILAGSSRYNLALVRYSAAGAPDPSFGSSGKVYGTGITSTEEQANAIALQSDGKIVIAGQSQTGNNLDVIVARYLENGSLDPAFGIGGRTITPFGVGNPPSVANAVVVLPGGKILVAGTTAGAFLLLRYTSDGMLDTGFGNGGGTAVSFANSVNAGYGLAVQNDGKILLTGTSTINGRDYFALLQFTTEGALDAGFSSGGGVIATLTSGSDSARAIALQSDRKIGVAGYGGALNAKDFAIIRFEGVPPVTPVTLESWRQRYFNTTANSGDAANDNDFDKDGLVNLVEYAFGQDPTRADSHSVPSGQVSDGNFFVSFTQPATVTGITYGAQSSRSLTPGSWTPLADTGSGSTHTFKVPISGNTRAYIRLTVSAP